VRRHHHVCGRDVGDLVLDFHPLRSKLLENGFVVHQVAQDRHRPRLAFGQREADRIPHSETHAEMGGPQNFHVWIVSFALHIDFAIQSI
jgi:hypothetical protein